MSSVYELLRVADYVMPMWMHCKHTTQPHTHVHSQSCKIDIFARRRLSTVKTRVCSWAAYLFHSTSWLRQHQLKQICECVLAITWHAHKTHHSNETCDQRKRILLHTITTFLYYSRTRSSRPCAYSFRIGGECMRSSSLAIQLFLSIFFALSQYFRVEYSVFVCFSIGTRDCDFRSDFCFIF